MNYSKWGTPYVYLNCFELGGVMMHVAEMARSVVNALHLANPALVHGCYGCTRLWNYTRSYFKMRCWKVSALTCRPDAWHAWTYSCGAFCAYVLAWLGNVPLEVFWAYIGKWSELSLNCSQQYQRRLLQTLQLFKTNLMFITIEPHRVTDPTVVQNKFDVHNM